MLVCGLTFAAGCIPFAVQNYVTSGSAVIPSQASGAVKKGISEGLGFGGEGASRVFAGSAEFLYEHFGLAEKVKIKYG